MSRTSFAWLIPLTLGLILLSGCSALIGDAREALYPTNTPEITPEHTKIGAPPTRVATAAVPVMPSPSAEGNIVETATPTLVADKGRRLVYLHDETLYRSGGMGQEPEELGIVPRLEAWDWYEGRLAMASAVDVMLIDLNVGSLVNPDIEVESDVLATQVLWSLDGARLLVALTLGDMQAPTSGRRVELIALEAGGTLVARTTLYDLLGLQLLRYDAAQGQVMLIPMADEGALTKVETYTLESGKLVDSRPISGQGEAWLSPDGQFLLTQTQVKGQEALQIFDLAAEGQVRPRVWEYGEDAVALDPLWAPDSGSLAYLLTEGQGENAQPKGLWRLDLTKMRAAQVIAETTIGSMLVAWAPDAEEIVGYHQGDAGGSYYYTVRPDGGGFSILGLDAQASILGWMEPPQEPVPPVVVDLWKRRFLDVAQDPVALVNLIAAYVDQGAERGADVLADEIAGYMGVTDEQAPHLAQVGSGTFLLEWASSIHLLQAGQTQAISHGHIVAARRQNDQVGLILAIDLMGARQQAFMLLQADDAETWRVAWMPQGLSDWIATDGEITFGGEGLETLTVRGSSFGLDVGDDAVFVECHDCPHRWFTATWRAEAEGYVRETTLSANASRYDMLWEMTEPTAYAVTFEALRRMRQDLPLDLVIDNPEVIEQATALGLLDIETRLSVSDVTEKQVRFEDLEGQSQFVATVKDGRLTELSQD